MGKGFIFIGLALFIDALQAFLDWAFIAAGGALTAATPVGAGLAGAAAGAAACWDSSGNIISGVVGAIKCGLISGAVWGALSPVGIPLGIGIGFAVNFVISATFGVMLVTGLYFFGIAKPGDGFLFAGAGLAETIPGVSALFWWTTATARVVFKSKAKQIATHALPLVVSTLETHTNTPRAANENQRRVGQEAYAA